MLAWFSVGSEAQTCIWPSWCHCHSLSLASVKSRLVLPFCMVPAHLSSPGQRAIKRVCIGLMPYYVTCVIRRKAAAFRWTVSVIRDASSAMLRFACWWTTIITSRLQITQRPILFFLPTFSRQSVDVATDCKADEWLWSCGRQKRSIWRPPVHKRSGNGKWRCGRCLASSIEMRGAVGVSLWDASPSRNHHFH